ncbi:MAG TPA: hypothetical protein VMZ26_11170 [Pyrinomonadaceae bacterium]|nr:hypothetical protein [Pyrinomonadaceae bacterium]
MSGLQHTCIKCGGETIKGFAADRGEHHHFPTRWVDGEPTRTTWLGVTGDNVEIDDPVQRTIRGLRCATCGYLELYAVKFEKS